MAMVGTNLVPRQSFDRYTPNPRNHLPAGPKGSSIHLMQLHVRGILQPRQPDVLRWDPAA